MTNQNFSDWTKAFSQFNAPKVDMSQVIAQFKRDAEAFTSAMQILTEANQQNLRICTNLTRSNAEHAFKASKEMMNHSSPENAASKQADFAKSCIEHNVNGVREICETQTKATQEAFDLLSKRAAEKMKDFSDVAGQTTTSAKKKAA